MTRLREEWIRNLEDELSAYEIDLQQRVGLSLLGLSAYANGISEEVLRNQVQKERAAVIPITTGLGVIPTFAEGVASILRRLGFQASVTQSFDVEGIYEAYQTGASILFLADDDRFVGIHRGKNRITDNTFATAKGYVAALEYAASGLAGKDVLILGFGPMGQSMVNWLIEKGSFPKVYEQDPERKQLLSNEYRIDSIEGLGQYAFVLDATNEGGWIHCDMLREDAWIAAPGIPLSLDQDAHQKHRNRLIHDWLQIGVATMAGELCQI